MANRVIRHKFNAKRTEIDKIKFSSQKEARRYRELCQLQQTGDVLFFLRQTPFHLKGDPPIKYVDDFTVFWKDGTVTFEDVKGMKTDVYRLKKNMVEDQYPITITEK